MLDNLMVPVEDTEIRQAIFDLGKPLDGLQAGLYQAQWSIVGRGK